MKPLTKSFHFSLVLVGLLLLATGFTISKTRTLAKKNTSLPPTQNHDLTRQSQHPTTSRANHSLTANKNQADPERLLRLIATIERSSLETLPDLAGQFAKNGAALRLIAFHWFNLDPHHCLKSLLEIRIEQEDLSFDLLYHLSQQWIAKDLPDFVTTIEKLPLQQRKWWGFTDIFVDIADNDYRAGLRLMREAEQTNTSPSSSQVDRLAAENPRKIADDLRQLAGGYGLTHALEQVATQWAKSEPEEALTYASKIPGKRGLKMSSAALTSWATLDPLASETWLSNHPNTRIQDNLRPALLNAWHKKDPEAAQQYCLTKLNGFRQRQALRLLKKAPPLD